MSEIKFGDGKVGIKENPNVNVVNPKINVVNPGEKASSKHRFLMNVGGRPIEVNGGLKKIQANDIVAQMKTEMRDQNGKKVKQVTYIKSTGELLPSGTTGRKHINEEGLDVPHSDLKTFQINEDGTETEIAEFEKTDVVEAVKTLPAGSENSYLIEEEYELMPDSDKDSYALWEMAKHLHENGLIATGVVVPRRGWSKYGCLIVPHVDPKTGKFAVVVKFTKSKYEVPVMIDIPKGPAPVGKAKTGAEVKTGVEELF